MQSEEPLGATTGHRVLVREDGTLEHRGPKGEIDTHKVDLREIAEIQQRHRPGWVEWAEWTNDTGLPLTGLAGSFTVPEAPPRKAGQAVFLFLGLQKGPGDPSELLQPVLQWGESVAGGGDGWGLCCWYVKDEWAVFSDLETVQPGDRVHVSMERSKEAAAVWWTARAVAGPVISELHVLRDLDLIWCYTTLEAYTLDAMACDMYPGSAETIFEELSLFSERERLMPKWEPRVRVHDCNQEVYVQDPRRIVLRYR